GLSTNDRRATSGRPRLVDAREDVPPSPRPHREVERPIAVQVGRIGTTNAISAEAADVRPGLGAPVNPGRTRSAVFEGAKVRVGMATANCREGPCAGAG